MTKMSNARKAKKGVVETPVLRRGLTKEELREYIELLKLCNSQAWRMMQIKSNTALIHNGIEVAHTEEDITKLLENAKNNWLSQVLTACGVPTGQSVNINSETGEVVDTDAKPDEDDPKPVKPKKK